MNVSWGEVALFSMKVSPEVSSCSIDGSSTHIQIAGTACSCLQFCQERHYIPDGVDYMAADHNVSREIIRGILPGSLETLDVGEFPLMQGLTQIVQHTSIWFNGGDMLYQWGKCQCK